MTTIFHGTDRRQGPPPAVLPAELYREGLNATDTAVLDWYRSHPGMDWEMAARALMMDETEACKITWRLYFDRFLQAHVNLGLTRFTAIF